MKQYGTKRTILQNLRQKYKDSTFKGYLILDNSELVYITNITKKNVYYTYPRDSKEHKVSCLGDIDKIFETKYEVISYYQELYTKLDNKIYYYNNKIEVVHNQLYRLSKELKDIV